jgi:hypothetical protein
MDKDVRTPLIRPDAQVHEVKSPVTMRLSKADMEIDSKFDSRMGVNCSAVRVFTVHKMMR